MSLPVWVPPGPVSARFMRSTAPIQILNGPVGSGKTTTVLMKGLRIAYQQEPVPEEIETVDLGDGVRRRVRYTRGTVIRDTYRQLWKTVIPSWHARVPEGAGEWRGSEGAPASHSLVMPLRDGTVAKMHVDFIAVGDMNAEDVMRGYEPTWIYINEADLTAEELYNHAATRTGRYPRMELGGPTWHGLLLDCNAPEFESWIYRNIFLLTPAEREAKGIELFRQPGGRSPNAENRKNLPPDYYDRIARSQPEDVVRRLVDNEPGVSVAGTAVFRREFSDATHVAGHELEALPGFKLIIGVDGGLSPAAAIGQRPPSGQLRVIDELVAEHGTGPTRFGQNLARMLAERYPAWGNDEIEVWADPASAYGADKAAGEKSWMEVFAAVSGLRVRPAPTNALHPRLESIRAPLTRMIDGRPGFVLAPRCRMIRQGFSNGYRFQKFRTGTSDTPEKNEFSHVMDALQYLSSGAGEDTAIRQRVGDDRSRRQKTLQQEKSWSLFGGSN